MGGGGGGEEWGGTGKSKGIDGAEHHCKSKGHLQYDYVRM